MVCAKSCRGRNACVRGRFMMRSRFASPRISALSSAFSAALLPQAFGQAKTQLISIDEGVGKVKAAVEARGDPALVIVGRTGAAAVTSIDDAIARAKAYEAVGVDALFFTGAKTRGELETIAA